MAFQGASSSSSSTGRWTHDVFLSFRGEDTRDNITAHLHNALRQKGINTFIDNEITRGEEISPALVEAIQESRISIIVFSQTYASSRWCLDEVLEILECKKTKKQTVLPVFYMVEPSDVRDQKNSFKEAFAEHEERFKDDMKVQSWKEALKQVADLTGYPFASGNEAQFIDGIVQDVSRIVNPKYLHVAKHPVGLESHVQKINSLLRIDENGIRTVGILGVSGIGKTTIAKDIYNSIYFQFDGCCFLESVREASKKHFGIVELQCKLLSAILGHTVNVDSVSQGISVINQRLCSKKVLLILDDVDNTEQLDKLAGGADWFGSGSRIIITTRDRKVLIDREVDDDLIYRVKELDKKEALELFRWNAFKEDKPTDDFLELMEGAVNHVGGLPLALEVLGSYLYGRDIHQWKSALQMYKRIPHRSIQEILRISYDGLHATEQDIFLDIACFFKGMREDYVKTILESCDFFPNHGIKVLTEKSLITIDGFNRLGMHDLLQDMGREIVREESPKDPSKRSKLWFHEDVRKVLEEDTGTDAIQGILINLPKGEEMLLSSEAFKNMKSLRLLMVYGGVCFSQGPIFLPNELRVLDWRNCPLEFLPSNFDGRNLVTLRMPCSRLKGLEGVQKFQSLKIMDFSECEFLKIIPDVSKIPNLEKLTLDYCTSLVEIHDSVGSHDKLVSLCLKNCYNLSRFPTSFKLRSLKYLNLNGCSKINHFPKIECQMEFLKFIDFGGTGIKELPSSIQYLIGLEQLCLEGCINLTNLPSRIYQLQHLWVLALNGCSKLVKFPEKMGDNGQSMLPPTNSSVSNDDCSSIPNLYVAKHPVGIESHAQKIHSLLRIDKINDIRMVGILGVGGIGKTMIAKDIYNSIYSQFDGCCFLESIREASKKRSGMVKLQSKLLSAILGDTMKVDSVSVGISLIKRRLCSKKVLLILDDVDNNEQLDKLAGGVDWFGSGSRIIITTRDRKVLIDHEVNDDQIYRMKELYMNEALELFSWNSFKGAKPTESMTSSLAFRGASSSFSSTHQWTHDVFLSFRGEDTRRNFIADLYDALDRRGINTYIDDEQLESGENILPALVKVIEESRISVIVVTQKYASSPRCLDELTNILECKKTNGQIVLPVFYKGDQSDVQQLLSSFGEAFVKLEQRFKDDQRRVHKWKTALTHVANLWGYHLDDRDEAKCIREIVQKIANHIKAAKHVAKHPIAIKSPLHVPDLPSSPAQVLDSSSSPSRVGIESPAQGSDSSSPSRVEIQAPEQVVNLSSSPSGNGDQGSNPSISSEQRSNSSILSQGAILFLIGSVIGLLQLDHLFEKYPANMWISEVALVMFCLSYATMTKIDGTRWAKYSQIIDRFRVLSGTLVAVSLSSIHLPHRLWWLFFVIWALLGFILVAHTWIYSGANRRNDEEMGQQMMSLIRPTLSVTLVENSSDAAHS